jgi:hypothetical protein
LLFALPRGTLTQLPAEVFMIERKMYERSTVSANVREYEKYHSMKLLSMIEGAVIYLESALL